MTRRRDAVRRGSGTVARGCLRPRALLPGASAERLPNAEECVGATLGNSSWKCSGRRRWPPRPR